MQCAREYSIALCSNISPNTTIIVQFWCRINNTEIPEDLMSIIVIYHNINTVLSVGFSGTGGLGHGAGIMSLNKWTEIEGLRGKQIEKIRVGMYHSFFLDSAGNVWCCGHNNRGQLGMGPSMGNVNVFDIQCVDFFVKNGIKIKEIMCGSYFSVILDYNGRVWVFGENNYGQLGLGEDAGDISLPTELELFRDLEVEVIRCGAHHCYIGCADGKHYLWGDNEHCECLVFDDMVSVVWEPRLIELKDMKVKDVFLGNDNTKIIVSDN